MAITVVDGVEGKVCPKCDPPTWKPLGYFHAHKGGSGGRSSVCKACKSSYKKNWRKNNIDEVLKKAKDYRVANRKELNEKRRKYRENNRDAEKEYSKQYYITHNQERRKYKTKYTAGNIEKVREQRKRWWAVNKDKTRTYRLNRRAREASAPGEVAAEELLTILEAQSYLCYYCGVILIDSHIDHKTPLSRGGTNNPDNLCVTCAHCNLSKNAKTEAEFRAYLV